MKRKHIPALRKEVLELLHLKPNENVIDGTLGYGGHSQEMLEKIAPHGRLLGIDLDQEAIDWVKKSFARIRSFQHRFMLVQGNFRHLKEIHESVGGWPVHHVFFDLGVSSAQLESTSRGFGFRSQARLGMGFQLDSQQNAWSIVNTWSERDLEHIFRKYGEEPLAKRIACAVIRERKIHTLDTPPMLVEVVSDVYQHAPFKFRLLAREKHPATKVFQALRIAVNQELENISLALPQALEMLEPGGTLAVISFHSLEDRIVKNFLKRESRDCLCPKEIPLCQCGHAAQIKILTKKPIIPSEKEISQNPRAKSAKLRGALKL